MERWGLGAGWTGEHQSAWISQISQFGFLRSPVLRFLKSPNLDFSNLTIWISHISQFGFLKSPSRFLKEGDCDNAILQDGPLLDVNSLWRTFPQKNPIQGWSLSGGESWWRIRTMREGARMRSSSLLQSPRLKWWCLWHTTIKRCERGAFGRCRRNAIHPQAALTRVAIFQVSFVWNNFNNFHLSFARECFKMPNMSSCLSQNFRVPLKAFIF